MCALPPGVNPPEKQLWKTPVYFTSALVVEENHRVLSKDQERKGTTQVG